MGEKKLQIDNFSLVNMDGQYQVLKNIIRNTSLSTLLKTVDVKNTKIEEVEIEDDFIYGQLLTFILIYGPRIKMSLKVHYFQKLATGLVAQKFKLPIEKVTRHDTDDFMREYANLAAGYIIGDLGQSNIYTNTSLPLVTNGFDEAYSTDNTHPSEIKDWWKITWDGGFFYWSSVTEFRDLSALQNLKAPIKESGTDEMEGLRFL